MSSIVVAGDVSGAVSIVAPSVAGTTTLTLPSVSGTLVSTGNAVSFSSVTTPIINSATTLQLQTNGTTTAVTIDASQNVGIGTSSPAGRLTIAGSVNPNIIQSSTGGITVSSSAIDSIGGGYYGTTSNHPQMFYTNNTERMRIDSSGVVLIGTTGGYATTPTSLGISNNSSTWQLMCMKQAYAGSACFINMANASTVGLGWDYGVGSSTSNWNWRYNAAVVSSIASATGVYTALSDANKKKDFELSTLGLDVVMGLKPTLFRMIDEEETAPLSLGFIAQDVQPLIPQAYVKQGEFIGLQDRPFIAVLTKAIQEQQALITTLQTQITALNAKVGI